MAHISAKMDSNSLVVLSAAPHLREREGGEERGGGEKDLAEWIRERENGASMNIKFMFDTAERLKKHKSKT